MYDRNPDDVPVAQDIVLRDVLAGLDQAQKALPGTYLWDATGSDLFDRICRTDDYYLARAETALLREAAPTIAARLGRGARVVEYGSGASHKVRLLLDALEAPAAYVAIDISAAYLAAAAERIAADYPDLEVRPVVADYTAPIMLPEIEGGSVIGFFPGSTIGNFAPEGVVGFLDRARATLAGGRLLIGHDPCREPERLRRAYGEAEGLMPALHLNMLTHLNRLIGSDFDPANFRHEIRIVADPFRVEAHLVARAPATYRVGGRRVRIAEGESIRTDRSHKMSVDDFIGLAAASGWGSEQRWLGGDGLCALHLLRPA